MAMQDEEFTEADIAAAQAAEEEVSEADLFAAAQAAEEPAGAAPMSPTQRMRAAARNPGVARSIGSTLLQGFFKGGSDEGAGALTRMMVNPGGGAAWRQPDGSTRFLETAGDVYRAGRDAEREVLRGARENYPKTAFALEMLGDLGSDAVATGLGVNAATPLYNTLSGGLSALLSSDAELTPDKATPGSRLAAAGSTALGAGLGAVLPKVGEGVARFTPAALRALRTWLENTAVAQGTRVLLNGADQLARVKPPAAEAVLEAIDSGAIRPFSNVQNAFKRLEKQGEQWGQTYGSIVEELEKAGVKGPDADALARELTGTGDTLMRQTGADKAVPNVYFDEAANLETLAREPQAMDALTRVRQALQGVELPPATPDARLGLTQSENIKRALQEKARYGDLKDTPINDARMEVASVMRQGVEDAIEAAGKAAPDGSDLRQLSESFVPVKQKLSKVLAAREAAEKGTAAAAKRRGLSMSDYLAAGMGSGITDKISLATLNNLARNRGTSAVASGARGLSRLARAGANAAAANPAVVQLGGNELGALLGRQLSPALAELLGLASDPQDETNAALAEALRARGTTP